MALFGTNQMALFWYKSLTGVQLAYLQTIKSEKRKSLLAGGVFGRLRIACGVPSSIEHGCSCFDYGNTDLCTVA